MVFKPNLRDYSEKELMALFATATDEFLKDDIRVIILSKFSEFDYPLFYLVNKFSLSKGAYREIYADAILMHSISDITGIEIVPVEVIVKSASIEALGYYGMNSKFLELKKKCKEEFYSRGMEIEPEGKYEAPQKRQRIINFK